MFVPNSVKVFKKFETLEDKHIEWWSCKPTLSFIRKGKWGKN